MSNLSKITGVVITDLSLLSKACSNLGLELNLSKKTYKSKWISEIKCDAVVQGKEQGEAAIVHTDNGYEIQWDSYSNSLRKVVGNKCEKLNREYSTQAVLKQAETVGMVNSIMTQEDGTVVVQGVFV